MVRPALVIHGGAGRVSSDREAERRAGCSVAIAAGWSVLERGGSALDAVCEAVVELENCPLFNAGKGSALNVAGAVEMDASLMEGTRLRVGAAAVVRGVRNPIRLARAILEAENAVFLAGGGAEDFARAHGIEMCSPEHLITPQTLERWRKSASSSERGTVGAVAVDAAGGVAAATSTGGIDGKPVGRIGDSAVIGAGTFAADALGAISATGVGEAIIRAVWARDTAEQLRSGADPAPVAAAAVTRLERATAGKGGLIIVDPYGRIGYAFNTPHMTFGWMRADRTEPEVHA